MLFLVLLKSIFSLENEISLDHATLKASCLHLPTNQIVSLEFVIGRDWQAEQFSLVI